MYVATLDNVEYKIEVKEIGKDKYEVKIDNTPYVVDAHPTEFSVYSLIINDKSYEIDLDTKTGFIMYTARVVFLRLK